MNKKLLSWLLLFCALGLSSTAAYYSVVGLSIIFAGVAIPVIIMGSFLEVSKIIIATYLHNQWKKTYTGLKIYLTLSLIVLSVITSIGIYGLLSKGFQTNITKMEIDSKRVANIEVKKNRFKETKQEFILEKKNIEGDITQTREALTTGTTTQYKDRETGQIITVNSSKIRKTFEAQLNAVIGDRDTLSTKIEALNDSITNLEITILNMETDNETSNELGVIKSFSELTGWSLQAVANLFILILIFVFDPLAITLVIATNQSFKNSKTKKNMYGEKIKGDWSKKIPSVDAEDKIVKALEEELPLTLNSSKTTELTFEEQVKFLQNQITKIQNSNVSGRKKLAAIDPLTTQIQILTSKKEGEQKTY